MLSDAREWRSWITAAAGLVPSIVLLLACSDGNHMPTPPGPTEPTGSLVEASECKVGLSSDPDSVDSCVDCLAYTYAADATLDLTHVNAGFNCCPGEITADITFQDSLIVVEEHERESGCDCLCLYDIDYRIENLRPRVYTIRVVELYLRDGDEPLEFTLDLSAPVSGQHCAERTGYPWCLELYQAGGELVSVSGCKVGADTQGPQEEECMEYAYADDGTLDLLHVNAIFNCCPGEITGEVSVEPGPDYSTITISEHEAINGCRCSCPYDLAYQLPQLPPGIYRIMTVEYCDWGDWPGHTTLDFTVDLSSPTSGIYCEP